MYINDCGTRGFCQKNKIIVGFLHEHKISRKNDFDALLQGGKTTVCFPLKFIYTIKNDATPSFQVAVSVAKKRFHNAVDRNLLKRRIREGVRHIYPQKDFSSFATQILIVYCDKSIAPQNLIEKQIDAGFQKILSNAKSL